VLDSRAAPLDIEQLTKHELVYAILRWSALPGASRHHWGTDIDVYDENARPSGYEIELTPEEVDAGGMFAPLHEWLDQRLAAGAGHGFFRPYDQDRQGVAPEQRDAAFVCVLVLRSPAGEEWSFSGRCRGRIGETLTGSGGFGYDPVFLVPPDFRRTMAELSPEEKNRLSHRGAALRQLCDWLGRH
jgi:hypothetical protein